MQQVTAKEFEATVGAFHAATMEQVPINVTILTLEYFEIAKSIAMSHKNGIHQAWPRLRGSVEAEFRAMTVLNQAMLKPLKSDGYMYVLMFVMLLILFFVLFLL